MMRMNGFCNILSINWGFSQPFKAKMPHRTPYTFWRFDKNQNSNSHNDPMNYFTQLLLLTLSTDFQCWFYRNHNAECARKDYFFLFGPLCFSLFFFVIRSIIFKTAPFTTARETTMINENASSFTFHFLRGLYSIASCFHCGFIDAMNEGLISVCFFGNCFWCHCCRWASHDQTNPSESNAIHNFQ